ncbi:MAG: hypothetical protein U0790_10890 [Isosphaeraceae bacterium]
MSSLVVASRAAWIARSRCRWSSSREATLARLNHHDRLVVGSSARSIAWRYACPASCQREQGGSPRP